MSLVKRLVMAMVMGAVTLSIIVGWSWRETLDCKSNVPGADTTGDGLFRLIPSKIKVWPGQEIAITIESPQPGTIVRGIASNLECWNGEGWATKYVLLTPNESRGKPSAHPFPLPTDLVIPSIALVGPGPERIRLPFNLKPGWYRIRKEFDLENETPMLSQMAYARVRVLP